MERFFAGLLAIGVAMHKRELIELAATSTDTIVATAKWSLGWGAWRACWFTSRQRSAATFPLE